MAGDALAASLGEGANVVILEGNPEADNGNQRRMGFEDVPAAGDILQGTESEAKALEVSSYRSQREKEEGLLATRKVSLENLFDSIAESETKELNVVIKADVQGSLEPIVSSLQEMSASDEEGKIRVRSLADKPEESEKAQKFHREDQYRTSQSGYRGGFFGPLPDRATDPCRIVFVACHRSVS